LNDQINIFLAAFFFSEEIVLLLICILISLPVSKLISGYYPAQFNRLSYFQTP